MKTLLFLWVILLSLTAVSSRNHLLKNFFKNNVPIPTSPFAQKPVPTQPIDILDGSCSSCKLAMKAFDSYFQSDEVALKIEAWAIDGCLKYLSYGEEVCTDMVNRMAPILIEVLANSYLESNYFCVEVLEVCDSPTFTKFDANEYVSQMLSDKPAEIQDNDFVNKLYEQMKADPNPRKTLKAVLISDSHLDYDQELTEEKPFGEMGRETSQKTIEAVLKYIKEDIQPDFFFWTGDNAKSDGWANEVDDVVFYTKNLTEMVKEMDIDQIASVYPIEGNHDLFPLNIQDFSEPGVNEAFIGYKDGWRDWMSEEEFGVFEQYGYYSKPLEGINGESYGNTKVIAMNTASCYYYNWYLIENRYDPGNLLDFLVSELSQLEKEDGRAILISHVPPSTECVHEWGQRFRAITERYQHVIRFSLYGHKHRVMYQVAKSFQDDKNVGLDFLTGSVAMQPNGLPCFSLIEIDEELMIPVNFKVYVLDIEESNAKKSPIIRLQNDHLQMYELEDVSPDSMNQLSERMLEDEETAILYLWNQYRQYGMSPECDELCRRNWYCETTSTEVYQYEACVQTKPDILGGAFFGIIMNYLVSPWILQDE